MQLGYFCKVEVDFGIIKPLFFIFSIIKNDQIVFIPEIRDVSILVVDIGLISSCWHVNFPNSKILY